MYHLEVYQKLCKYKSILVQKYRRTNITVIIAILRLFELSVAHDINSCKHGLCWKLSVDTNKFIGLISGMFSFFNNIRDTRLVSKVYE